MLANIEECLAVVTLSTPAPVYREANPLAITSLSHYSNFNHIYSSILSRPILVTLSAFRIQVSRALVLDIQPSRFGARALAWSV